MQPSDGEQPALVKDAFDLAMEAAQTGRDGGSAFHHHARGGAGKSGRGRFLRKVQLAHICLATRNESIGGPILDQLSEEIERRQLEEWEAPEAGCAAAGDAGPLSGPIVRGPGAEKKALLTNLPAGSGSSVVAGEVTMAKDIFEPGISVSLLDRLTDQEPRVKTEPPWNRAPVVAAD